MRSRRVRRPRSYRNRPVRRMRGRGYYNSRTTGSLSRVYRPPSYARGRGAYKIPGFNAKKLGRALGSAGGAALGNFIAPGIGGELGSTAGSAVGEALGRGFRWLTGFGDYEVRNNSLLHPGEVLPSFGPDTIRVRKREYICDIPASVAFSNNVFTVNPGLSEVFPWLSAIAANYEQYRWNGLIFEYVSQAAVAVSTADNIRLGTVCMASDYNAIDDPYANMPQMLSTMFSNSARPSDTFAHAVECAPTDTAQKLYYCRSGSAPTNSDIRLYDMLSFQVGVEGMPTGTNDQAVGQLWVNYDITFCKSVQNNQLGFDLNTDKYILVAPAVAGTAYFGTSRTKQAGSNLGIELGSGSAGRMAFPPTLSSGFYLVIYVVVGASTAITAPTIAPDPAGSCSVVSAWTNNTDADIVSTGTTTTLITMQVYKILTRDAGVIWSGGTLPTSPTFGDLVITQLNGELFL